MPGQHALYKSAKKKYSCVYTPIYIVNFIGNVLHVPLKRGYFTHPNKQLKSYPALNTPEVELDAVLIKCIEASFVHLLITANIIELKRVSRWEFRVSAWHVFVWK